MLAARVYVNNHLRTVFVSLYLNHICKLINYNFCCSRTEREGKQPNKNFKYKTMIKNCIVLVYTNYKLYISYYRVMGLYQLSKTCYF